MHQQSADADQLLGFQAAGHGMGHQGPAQPLPLMPPVHRQTAERHHRQWVRHVAPQGTRHLAKNDRARCQAVESDHHAPLAQDPGA